MKTLQPDDRDDPFDRAERALQLAIEELREAAGDQAPSARDVEIRLEPAPPIADAPRVEPPSRIDVIPSAEPTPRTEAAPSAEPASGFMWAAEPIAEFSPAPAASPAPAPAESAVPAPAGLHVASVSEIAIPASELVALRLDLDVIAHYQASGPGWQGRVNAALRKAAGL